MPIGQSLQGKADRYRCFRRMAETSRNYSAPKLLKVDSSSRAIEMEYLRLECTIGDAVRLALSQRDLEAAYKLVETAAGALAEIHSASCWVSRRCLTDLIPPALSGGDVPRGSAPVHLHGDFGFSNIWLPNATNPVGRLTVLDPFPPPYMSQVNSLEGPPEWDVGVFLSCMAGRPPLGLFRSRSDRRLLARAFVSAYEGAREVKLLNLADWVRLALLGNAFSKGRGGQQVRRIVAPFMVRTVCR